MLQWFSKSSKSSLLFTLLLLLLLLLMVFLNSSMPSAMFVRFHWMCLWSPMSLTGFLNVDALGVSLFMSILLLLMLAQILKM